MLIIRSPVHLDLHDGPSHAVSSAVVSVTPPHLANPNGENSCKFLAALRTNNATERRLEVYFRPVEGEAGEIILTIVSAGTGTTSNPSAASKLVSSQPSSSSGKQAKMIRFPLKPLSLHHRVHVKTDSDRPHNMVKFTGTYREVWGVRLGMG